MDEKTKTEIKSSLHEIDLLMFNVINSFKNVTRCKKMGCEEYVCTQIQGEIQKVFDLIK